MSFSQPFNTPLEVGLRSLFVLDALKRKKQDLQRLVFCDYLLVHSGDVEGGPSSLHPAVPNRAGEWVVRRKLLAQGLHLMFSRELVCKQFSSEGIAFEATELTTAFISHMRGRYSMLLRTRAEWISNAFGNYSDRELATFMTSHLGKWGAEFHFESLFRGGE